MSVKSFDWVNYERIGQHSRIYLLLVCCSNISPFGLLALGLGSDEDQSDDQRAIVRETDLSISRGCQELLAQSPGKGAEGARRGKRDFRRHVTHVTFSWLLPSSPRGSKTN